MKLNTPRTASCVAAAAALSVASLGGPAAAQSTWKQTEFILATFVDPPADWRGQNLKADSARFSLVRQAGFNLLTAEQDPSVVGRDPEGIRYMLRLAKAVGLRTLIADSRWYPAWDHPFDESQAATAVQPYLDLPPSLREAMYGYALGDEPHFKPEHQRNLAQWKAFIERADPGKLVYYNLVGSLATDYDWGGFAGGSADKAMDDGETASYDRYLRSYVDEIRPSVVSYDHYPLYKDGSVRKDYFLNLEMVRRHAGVRPFWAFVMTVDHLDFADPGEQHLGFMYFCPVAYGAKGLVAFSYGHVGLEGYREAITDRDGAPTKKYALVRRMNTFVRRVVGPVVMKQPYVGAYHASDYPGQQSITPFDPSRSTVLQAIGNDRLLVGVFGKAPEYYLFVVNKAPSPVTGASLILKGSSWTVSAAPSVVGFTAATPVKYTDLATSVHQPTDGRVVPLPALAGGEGRLLKAVVRR